LDTDVEVVEAINQGEALVVEPGLDSLIRANRRNMHATRDAEGAVAETSCSFIVVPTPSDEHGLFSTRFVTEAAIPVGRALGRKKDYHLGVLVSTVLPGGTEQAVVSGLERESGKKCSESFGVCYSPEFTALGSAIHDTLNPELVLIGESDSRAGDELEGIYTQISDSKPAVVRTNFVNAELAKISINTYVTMKITFANTLAEICEHLPGGDVDVVTRALGCDSRIGPRYLKGGLGFGGPCFPRDTVAFSTFARQLGVDTPLAEGTHAYNQLVAARIANLARALLPPGGTACVIGLAYKLDTPVIEESQGLEIAQRLAASGATVQVYDPLAVEGARRRLNRSVKYATSIEEGIEGADVVILANPLPELKTLLPELGKDGRRRVVVIDCWRCLPELAGKKHVQYVGLGLGASGSVQEPQSRPID
jgi:UDPglucose 6-dehydrogenase